MGNKEHPLPRDLCVCFSLHHCSITSIVQIKCVMKGRSTTFAATVTLYIFCCSPPVSVSHHNRLWQLSKQKKSQAFSLVGDSGSSFCLVCYGFLVVVMSWLLSWIRVTHRNHFWSFSSRVVFTLVPRENIRCKPRFSLKSRLSSSIKGHVIFLINFCHLLQSILTTLAHFNKSLIFVQKSDFDKIANHNRTLIPPIFSPIIIEY